MEIRQYEVHLTCLDHTVGHQIKKTRPRVVTSPPQHPAHPMTSKSHAYHTRASLTFQGKKGWIVLDQIRTVDRRRLVNRLVKINETATAKVKAVLR